jgi:hypothetical protein
MIYTLNHTTNKEENILTIKANHDGTIIQNKTPMIKTIEGVNPLSNNKEESMAVMKETIAGGSVVEE